MISRDTGLEVPDVVRGDDQEGWYEQYQRNPASGGWLVGSDNKVVVRRRKGRILFLRDRTGQEDA